MEREFIEELHELAQSERNRQIPIDEREGLLYENYNKYSRLKDNILRKRGAIKDPINQYSDPLSDVTRKERKLLLSLSLLILIVIKVGLFPTKIAAFGIDFEAKDISAFFTILGLVILYLLIVFIIYCFFDIRKWSLQAIKSGKDILDYSPIELKDVKTFQQLLDVVIELERLRHQVEFYLNRTKYNSYFTSSRIFIEFVFPILFSVYVLVQSLNFDSTKLNNSSDIITNTNSVEYPDSTNNEKDSILVTKKDTVK